MLPRYIPLITHDVIKIALVTRFDTESGSCRDHIANQWLDILGTVVSGGAPFSCGSSFSPCYLVPSLSFSVPLSLTLFLFI